jgi:hypothetical protein
VTAIAAANGWQQRSATAHNTRTTGDNLAYAMPEKTVGPGKQQQELQRRRTDSARCIGYLNNGCLLAPKDRTF